MSDNTKRLLPGKNLKLSTQEQIIVKPIGFGKLLIYEEAVTRLVTRIMDQGMSVEEIDDFRQLVRVAHEEVVGLMMLILDKPREWFDEIDIADAFDIIDVIVEQNWNPRVKKSAQKLLDRWKSVLQTPSKPLLDQDTHGPKSSDIP